MYDPYNPTNDSSQPGSGPGNIYSLTPGNPNPSDVGGGYGYPGSAPDPNAGYSNQNNGGGYTTSGGNPYGGMGTSLPWNQIFDTSLGNRQLDQSQQFQNYMTGTYYPFEQGMQQQVFDLQKQLQQAQMTGDYNGVQTLQAKLQQAQISLTNFQANQQASMQDAQMSGVYNGAPTLEAQQMMNTGALNQGNQYLTARGQDTSYDQSLMNMAGQFAGIQAQMAQSPLVAWYTARGLPPPQSAIMASNFQQTVAGTPQFQGLGQYQAPQLSWSFKDTAPGVGMLPTATNAGPQYAPTGQPINFPNPTGGGYSAPPYTTTLSGTPSTLASPNAALGAPTYQGAPAVMPTNVQVPPSAPPPPAMPTNSWMTPTPPPTSAPPAPPPGGYSPNYDPSLSQGAAPWASSLVNNTVMPSYVGNNGGVNVASAQQWNTMNPSEQQAAAQAAAMAGNPYYAQNVYNAAPEWGGLAPASYSGY